MSKEIPFKIIRENLPVIIFVVSFIVGWTWVQARLSAVEVLAKENKTTLDCINAINISIALIQQDIEFIKVQLKEL